jgi:hypothetical protein
MCRFLQVLPRPSSPRLTWGSETFALGFVRGVRHPMFSCRLSVRSQPAGLHLGAPPRPHQPHVLVATHLSGICPISPRAPDLRTACPSRRVPRTPRPVLVGPLAKVCSGLARTPTPSICSAPGQSRTARRQLPYVAARSFPTTFQPRLNAYAGPPILLARSGGPIQEAMPLSAAVVSAVPSLSTARYRPDSAFLAAQSVLRHFPTAAPATRGLRFSGSRRLTMPLRRADLGCSTTVLPPLLLAGGRLLRLHMPCGQRFPCLRRLGCVSRPRRQAASPLPCRLSLLLRRAREFLGLSGRVRWIGGVVPECPPRSCCLALPGKPVCSPHMPNPARALPQFVRNSRFALWCASGSRSVPPAETRGFRFPGLSITC